MTERRFTELQCRLTIAPFLRLPKKEKHLERRSLAYSFVRAVLATSLSLRSDHDVLNFFFFAALFIKSASLPLRFNFF